MCANTEKFLIAPFQNTHLFQNFKILQFSSPISIDRHPSIPTSTADRYQWKARLYVRQELDMRSTLVPCGTLFSVFFFNPQKMRENTEKFLIAPHFKKTHLPQNFKILQISSPHLHQSPPIDTHEHR
jgi:hypothetical protein